MNKNKRIIGFKYMKKNKNQITIGLKHRYHPPPPPFMGEKTRIKEPLVSFVTAGGGKRNIGFGYFKRPNIAIWLHDRKNKFMGNYLTFSNKIETHCYAWEPGF